MALKDITGQVFGRLTALKFMYTKRRVSMWLCKCTCGNEKIVGLSELSRGDTKSCGCLAKELQRVAMLHARKYKRYTLKT